jgi:cytochrome c
MRIVIPFILAAAFLAQAASAADPAKGKAVFQSTCAMCHSDVAGKNGIGPSLFGVPGRKAGSEPGFKYSPAMTKAGIAWTPENLDAFVASPQTVVHGTAMPFGGLKDAAKRADLVAYLGTLK